MGIRALPPFPYRSRPRCEWQGVLAPAIGSGGETPPELAGEDACGPPPAATHRGASSARFVRDDQTLKMIFHHLPVLAGLRLEIWE